MVEESSKQASLEQQLEKKVLKKSGCPECGSNDIIRDNDLGEDVCHDCGTVLPEKIMARGPEQRAFDPEQRAKRSRTGGPEDYGVHDKGLSTDISYRRSKTPEEGLRNFRLRKWQKRARIQTASERNLVIALHEIDKLASALNLPKALEETAYVHYRKALKKGFVKGRSIPVASVAAIYLTCRQTKTPRSLEEIAKISRVDKRLLQLVYRDFMNEEVVDYSDVKLPAYKEHANRISNKLGMSGRAQAMIYRILDGADKIKLLSGRSPTGMAATVTYMGGIMGNEHRTQKDIAEIAGVTEVTVRNRYHELMERLFIEVPL